MSTERRGILTVGLGRFLATDTSSQTPFGDAEKVKQMVAAAHQSVYEAGFDSEMIDLNPQEHDDSLKLLTEKLQSRRHDAMLVGYGIRGNRELTPLFEGIVQTWHQVSPETKIMFGNTPADVMTTIKRNYPNLK